jgi:hypothetical protein
MSSVYTGTDASASDVTPLVNELRRRGHPVLLAEEVFAADFQRNRLPLSFWPTDDHWNARAHLLLAHEISAWAKLLDQ